VIFAGVERRYTLRDHDDGSHVILDNILFNSIHNGFRRNSITSNMIASFIVICNDVDDFACSDLWFDGFHNLLLSLLETGVSP
jgi:hypothetical protein